MREPSSEGIFRTGTLGYIRFFWPFNHILLENFLVEVVLSSLLLLPHLQSLNALPVSLLHLLVFAANLFARTFWEVGLDESEVSSIELDELYYVWITSKNLDVSYGLQT